MAKETTDPPPNPTADRVNRCAVREMYANKREINTTITTSYSILNVSCYTRAMENNRNPTSTA